MSASPSPPATSAAAALATLERTIGEVPAESLPDVLGGLARLQARAYARLLLMPRDAAVLPDRTLNAREVAELIGTGKDWVYEHASEIPGSWRNGKILRFSAAAVEAWKHEKLRA